MRLGDKTLRSPLFLVSGVCAAAPETVARFAAEVEALGGITTKSIGLEPRSGYREPVLAEYEPGCFVNAVGLANPGLREFREEISAVAPLPGGAFLLISIFADGSHGDFASEFATLARELDPFADGFELNLSCPHVAAGGAQLGKTPENVARAVQAVCAVTRKPVLAKLSPNFGNIGELAAAAESAGAAGIAAINTVGPGLAVMPATTVPILGHGLGGLSGRGIRPVGVACVREIAARVRIPILGMGGIESVDDLQAYRAAGATFFGLGSALAGMPLTRIREYTAALLADLAAGGTASRAFVRTAAVMDYRAMRVAAVRRPGPNVAMLTLDQDLPADPGQFVMTWLPDTTGGAEKPYSVAGSHPLQLAVKDLGRFSRRLVQAEVGDEIRVRGPYGAQIPDLPGANLLLVGGGTGVAPLVFHHRRLAHLHAQAGTRHLLILACRCCEELLFDGELAAEEEHRVLWATDDGSVGQKGTAIDVLEQELGRDPTLLEGAVLVLCGPERMMAAGAARLSDRIPPERILLVLEPYMKCCVGICGSCALEDGRNACVDGHILSAQQVASFRHFGQCKRGPTGGLETPR